MLDWLDIAWDATFAAVAVSVFVGGFMRGFVGFGGALVSMPVLSMAFGPKLAVAVATVISVPATLQLLPQAIRDSERHVVLPVAVAIFLAAPLGCAILVAADPAIMKIAISALVVAMVAMLSSGWTFKAEATLGSLLAAGVAGGLIQGSAGIGGPPVVAVALARPGAPKLQRANVLGLMTAMALSSVPPLLAYGLITQRALVTGLVLLPIYSTATALGSRYFSTGGARHFRTAAFTTLGAIGVAKLIAAVRGYFVG